jgi:integrase
VTREVIGAVLDACPDAEWRSIVALSRFAGIRCPSETLLLTWQDIDWARGRMLVHSPKKEHLEHGADRCVPIFPELRPFLEAAFEQAESGALHVITRYRSTNQNLRTHLMRIIRRAGQDPWEKPFHNLRASRQTELTSEHPIHVVCAWLGNSALIAQKHYLQVTEGDFERAAGVGSESAAEMHVTRRKRHEVRRCPESP